ncbi:MAG: MoxR family ATPase [Candidatus Omnitrophica bacterium]|nr:MoxR family ATPase [Candidatus Omnitrophota bacterium]MCF7892272.1 MoxR family ATPase [Candidatus Omnitrophota bacterium]MCF7897594.1 MoxR family ATPase [Candidatus Omnitrophota bacterium]
MEDSLKKLNDLIGNIEKVIIGKIDNIKYLIVGLLTNGHILMEDVPGVGKTMLSLSLAKSIGAGFTRIQFTPDLLPSDVTGGHIYNPKTGDFDLKKGPVFTNILLADEINRTNPRTQSSLLECMQEYKVTLDGKTFPLLKPFMVVATQNPIEFQGTYPLPEAQIDRFLMKVSMGYVSQEGEMAVLKGQKSAHPVDSIEPVLTIEEVIMLQTKAQEVEVSEKILAYIVKMVSATRKNKNVEIGASPRASIALMNAARAWALLENRNYVIPDDVYRLVFPVLRHRLVLKAKASVSGVTPKTVITSIVDETSIK